MSTQRYQRLVDSTLRGRLADLRNAVEPILNGNYLPSFTDHSVSHSDRVCDLIDQLTEPLKQERQLRDQEAFILYAAAYLHDAGLQHQRAHDTDIVRAILRRPEYAGREWADLNIDTRRDIVRAQHHRISGEMITRSVNAAQPTVLGIQLTDDWHPGQIRVLCIAHNLYMDTTDKEEYCELVRDWGSFRMSLLSALLRLADILDESRRRSQLYLERTRELNLESRMHWWRHYYVAEIHIDPDERHITLWFDFPPERCPQYRAMIPLLQLPYLEGELARHGSVLARNNLLWHFRSSEISAAQSTARAMDDELEHFVLEKLAQQREQQAERDKLLVLDQLKVVRPTVERKLSNLRAVENSASAEQKLVEFAELARHLFRLGGRRDAWVTLLSEYNRLGKSVDTTTKLAVATELGEMMLEDGASSQAFRVLHDLAGQVESLPLSARFRFLRAVAQAYLERCAYTEAISALTDAAALAADENSREELLAQIDEARLLQGDLFIG